MRMAMSRELTERLSGIIKKEERTGRTETEALDAARIRMQNSGVLVQMQPYLPSYLQSAKDFCKVRSHIELVYLYAGQMVYQVNQQEFVLKEGELLWINPKAGWKRFSAGEEAAAVRFILLPDFFSWAFHMPEKEDNLLRYLLVNYMQGTMPYSSCLHFHVADIVQVQQLMEVMIRIALEGQPDEGEALQCGMKLLITLLTGYMNRMETGENSYEQVLLLRVLHYIETRYRDGEMAELCETFGYDMYWLSRAVKRITGKTYKEILQAKRMRRAVYLLENSRMSVAEISLAVGYRNTSYFHRMFREYYGVSPKQYRDKS